MRYLALVFWLSGVFIGGFFVDPLGDASSPKPLRQWSVSLAGDHDWSESKRTIDINMYRSPRVEFTDNSTVVITFMHPADRPAGQDRGGLMEPVSLKALFFDARDGHLRATLPWLGRRDASELRAVHDGGFLVHAGDKLTRFSSELKSLAQRDLDPTAEPERVRLRREWRMDIAPGGRVAFLRFRDGTEIEDFWIDVDTLAVDFSAKTTYLWNSVVSEDARAIRLPPRGSDPSHVMLWELGKDWRPVAKGYSVGTFLDHGFLLLYSQKEFIVIDKTGQSLFRGPLSYARVETPVIKRNLDGTCFAISEPHPALPVLQKHDFFDWNFAVKVVDVQQQKIVANFGLGTHDARQMDVALSPDCSHLAVLAESTLTVYAIR